MQSGIESDYSENMPYNPYPYSYSYPCLTFLFSFGKKGEDYFDGDVSDS